MAQILVRDLDAKVVKRLKARAQLHGRSLQGEVKEILEREAKMLLPNERQKTIEKWREHFAGRTFSDSTDLIREDREDPER